jgi:hypothetical protein
LDSTPWCGRRSLHLPNPPMRGGTRNPPSSRAGPRGRSRTASGPGVVSRCPSATPRASGPARTDRPPLPM